MNKILPYKNRLINYDKPVFIYRNLHCHASNCLYSISQNSLIVGHTGLILLQKCQFNVSQKGRERVLREQRKNVHARIKGFIAESGMGVEAEDKDLILPAKISYNPYTDESFICKNLTDKPFRVNKAECIILNSFGVFGAYLS